MGWKPGNIIGQLERYKEQRALVNPLDVMNVKFEFIDGVEYIINPDGSREIKHFRKIDDNTIVTD